MVGFELEIETSVYSPDTSLRMYIWSLSCRFSCLPVFQLEMSNMELTNELSSAGALLERERELIKEKVRTFFYLQYFSSTEKWILIYATPVCVFLSYPNIKS